MEQSLLYIAEDSSIKNDYDTLAVLLSGAWTETTESVTTYALRAIFKNEDFESLAQKHIICLNYHQNRLISKDLQTLKAATPHT